MILFIVIFSLTKTLKLILPKINMKRYLYNYFCSNFIYQNKIILIYQ